MYVEQLLLRCMLAKAHGLRKCILYVSALQWRSDDLEEGAEAIWAHSILWIFAVEPCTILCIYMLLALYNVNSNLSLQN